VHLAGTQGAQRYGRDEARSSLHVFAHGLKAWNPSVAILALQGFAFCGRRRVSLDSGDNALGVNGPCSWSRSAVSKDKRGVHSKVR
jgi:hypothetical protein